jgi:hypothetical protein
VNQTYEASAIYRLLLLPRRLAGDFKDRTRHSQNPQDFLRHKLKRLQVKWA